MCTCINCNGDISLHAWLKIVNQNGQCHGRNVLLHFYFARCAHAHIYNLYCAQGLPQGSSLKNKSVFGGSFIRVELVKEELTLVHRLRRRPNIVQTLGWCRPISLLCRIYNVGLMYFNVYYAGPK